MDQEQKTLARASLIAKYPYLTPNDGTKNPLVLGAKNLRAELKHAGITASVQSSRFANGNSLDVYVLEEDRLPEAQSIADKYCNRGFDGMTDQSYSIANPWHDVFGASSHTNASLAYGDQEAKLKGTYVAPAKVVPTQKEIEEKFLTAAQRGTQSVVEKLLPAIQAHSDPKVVERAWIHAARVIKKNDGALWALAEGSDPNAAPKDYNPLHFAAGWGRKKLAECLIERGADPNAQSGEGNTALHQAARGGHAELIDVLLGAGADPRIANHEGAVPTSRAPAIAQTLEAARHRLDLAQVAQNARPAEEDLATPEQAMARRSRGRVM